MCGAAVLYVEGKGWFYMSQKTSLEEQGGSTVLRRTGDESPPRSWRSRLIGRALPTADAPHQTVSKTVGLAVFASDAMSSTAYATQEILVILALAGMASFAFAFPISLAIVVLLAIVTLSYEQTIHAYPDGGGSYIVARDNLGDVAAQTAGAALLIDYILTVSVSVSSGVAQVVSAMPELAPLRAWLAIAMVGFVMVVNLRGVRESGAFFAIPGYFFIGMMYLMVITGLFRFANGSLGMVADPPHLELVGQTQAMGLLLLLRAFSSGTSAMTGVEAISNGVTAFREPRSRNAGITLLWMSAILGTLLLGITFLAGSIQAIPSEEETVISQIARTAFAGRGVPYVALIGATSLILILAANTSFAGFPRLGAILAVDGFLPRQLAYRGSRLVYSRGIMLLAVISSALILVYDASVTALIPLYAIGVFLAFTLSQAGMARRWWKSGQLAPGVAVKESGSTLRHERGWRPKMVSNAFGAACTAVVTIVFAVTKFRDGAWMVILLIPILVVLFSGVHRHYRGLAAQLSLDRYGAPAAITRDRVILPIGGVHRGTLAALRYARTLLDDITAVHVSIDPMEAERIRQKWETWGDGTRLVTLDSPYRLMLEPLADYIRDLAAHMEPTESVTVVVPQFVPEKRWHQALHMRTADVLRSVLIRQRGVVIIDVPYQVE
jgi:amino acid transporter